MKIVEPNYKIIYPTSDEELITQAKLVEKAGKISRKAEGNITDESYKTFLKGLLNMTPVHGSPFEFSFLAVEFTLDRGLTHELVRHRHAAFMQESSRYCNYSNDKFENQIQVIRPNSIKPDTVAFSVWESACLAAENSYFQLLSAGVKPEVARSVLPTCLKSTLFVGASFREWQAIFNLRDHKAAHPDLVLVMNKLHKELNSLLPEVFPLAN